MIDRIEKTFWPSPELTLANKDVSSVHLNQYVGFAFIVEGFACSVARKVTVQLNEKMSSEAFFVDLSKCGRALLHNFDHVFEHAQHMLIVVWSKNGFWNEG